MEKFNYGVRGTCCASSITSSVYTWPQIEEKDHRFLRQNITLWFAAFVLAAGDLNPHHPGKE